jgi:plastocyanin
MTSPLSRSTLVVPLVVAALVAACSSSTSSNNPKPAANVLVTSGAASKTTTAYAPATFTVSLASGGKVTWRNDDNITHTATDTAAAPNFSTGNLTPGDTASVVFTVAGTYGYHCSIHPGMVGTIIVNP